MNYQNGREARVGDAVVSLTNHLAGVVSRTDMEKLQFLTFAERAAGAPFTLIPVMAGARGRERHWEPVGVEVPSGTCLHVEDVNAGKAARGSRESAAAVAQLKSELAQVNGEAGGLRSELALLRADRERLAAELVTRDGPGVPANDPNQLALPQDVVNGEPAKAGTPNETGEAVPPGRDGTPNGTANGEPAPNPS